MTSISVDLALIFRVFGGFAWGIAWASYIQFNRHGKFLAKERTWLTVVIGIGIDLLIAYPAGWWTILFVIAASSLGIIARSLWNEHEQEVNGKSYKLIWALEDSIANAQTIIEVADALLVSETDAKNVRYAAKLLGEANKLKMTLTQARAGNYTQK